jgi:inositol-phosphate phosphatase / L-galactose 1-phosphate phosphatase / histidinol-phosphatase
MSVLIPPEFIVLAHRLADAAGAVICPYFRALRAIEIKPDQSPVTLADQQAEIAMRDVVRQVRPQDGVWGEEYGAENMTAEWVWTFDPIDGTRAFVTGKPLFGTLIGLLHQGAPVFGVLDQPILHERWWGGAGVAAQLNGEPIKTRACRQLDQAYLNTTTPAMFKDGDAAAFHKLAASTRDTLYGGDCYAYGLLASGHLDLVVEAQLKLHDYAALAPIIIAAGGVMTDWQGAPLTVSSDGRVVAAGDPALLTPSLTLLRTC